MGYAFRIGLRAETTAALAEQEAADSIRAWGFEDGQPSTLELVVPAHIRPAFCRMARRRLQAVMREEGAHPDSRVTVLTREEYCVREEAASGACRDE